MEMEMRVYNRDGVVVWMWVVRGASDVGVRGVEV